MTHPIPVGTSEPQDFELIDSGRPVNGTGVTVALEISKRVGDALVAVDTPPTVDWLDRTAGTVRVTGVETLTAGSYLVRFRLTDGSGKVGYTPNRERADLWIVVAIPAW